MQLPTLTLNDNDDGIEIVKSGAPAPSGELLAWLQTYCRGSYRFRCDHVFNVIFEFDDFSDALRFKARWGARDVGS